MNEELCYISSRPSLPVVRHWLRDGYTCEFEIYDDDFNSRYVSVTQTKKNGYGLETIYQGIQDDFRVGVYKRLCCNDLMVRRITASLFKLSFLFLKSFCSSGHFAKIPLLELSRKEGLRFRFKQILLHHTPGIYALRLSPSILAWATRDVRTVLVTGTNGKSTVTKMLFNGLKAAGIAAVYNATGYNLMGGIATIFIRNMRVGRPVKKYAVIECDEKWMMDVAPIVKPEIIVVTNISTDQVSRLHNVETVKRFIERSINDSAPRYVVSDDSLQLDIPDKRIEIVRYAEKEEYHSVIPGRHNVKNVATAITTLELLGQDSETVRQAVFDSPPPPGRYEKFKFDGHDVVLMLAKNKAGLSASFENIEHQQKFNLVLFFNDLQGDDKNTEWLTDGYLAVCVNSLDCNLIVGGSLGEMLDNYFQNCNSHPRQDVKRLDNIEEIASFIRDSKESVVIIANYSALWPIYGILK